MIFIDQATIGRLMAIRSEALFIGQTHEQLSAEGIAVRHFAEQVFGVADDILREVDTDTKERDAWCEKHADDACPIPDGAPF